MDIESVKVRLEILSFRLKTWLDILVRIAGVALVLLGAFNFFFVGPLEDAGMFTFYRVFGLGYSADIGTGIPFAIADAVAMGVGAAVAWFW